MTQPGDIMRAMACTSAMRQGEHPCLLSALKALNLARRSLRNDHFVEDAGLLLSIMGIAQDLCGPEEAGLKLDLEGEALAWYSILVDEGVEVPAYPFHRAVEDTDPEAVRRSQTYRKLILEGQD